MEKALGDMIHTTMGWVVKLQGYDVEVLLQWSDSTVLLELPLPLHAAASEADGGGSFGGGGGRRLSSRAYHLRDTTLTTRSRTLTGNCLCSAMPMRMPSQSEVRVDWDLPVLRGAGTCAIWRCTPRSPGRWRRWRRSDRAGWWWTCARPWPSTKFLGMAGGL
jgi:hypothetical protein